MLVEAQLAVWPPLFVSLPGVGSANEIQHRGGRPTFEKKNIPAAIRGNSTGTE